MLGELDGSQRARARELAAALEPIGPVRVTDNVRGMIWSKLLINSTFTGLSAVSGLRYGGVAEQGRDAVFALWAEGVAVGDAQGLSARARARRPASLRRRRAGRLHGRLRQRPPVDAAGPRRRPARPRSTSSTAASRHVGASSASRPRATTAWSSWCTRWNGASAPRTRAGWTTSARRRRSAPPTAESPTSPTRRGAGSGSKQCLPSLPGISMSRMTKPAACDGDADDPEHDRVVEAVPAGAGEVDREVQDEPERDQGGRGDQAGSLVALHHELAELARASAGRAR